MYIVLVAVKRVILTPTKKTVLEAHFLFWRLLVTECTADLVIYVNSLVKLD